jgi:hypothetical protein
MNPTYHQTVEPSLTGTNYPTVYSTLSASDDLFDRLVGLSTRRYQIRRLHRRYAYVDRNLANFVKVWNLLKPAARAEEIFPALLERKTGGHRQTFDDHFLFVV